MRCQRSKEDERSEQVSCQIQMREQGIHREFIVSGRQQIDMPSTNQRLILIMQPAAKSSAVDRPQYGFHLAMSSL